MPAIQCSRGLLLEKRTVGWLMVTCECVIVGVVVQFHIISCYTRYTDDVPLVAVSV